MATYVVWLDSEKAQIFNLGSQGIVKSHLQKGGVDHHSRNPKDHRGDAASEHYYQHLAERLKDAKEILLLGPGLAKNHFRKHLESHQAGLAKKVVGVENSDHPTDNQILAEARKFFATYNLYHEPIRQS